MKVQVEVDDLSAVRKRMRVSVAAEDASNEFGRLLDRYRKQARLPGFRPGKAPRELVKRHFHKEIEEDLYQNLVPKALESAIEDASLHPVGQARYADLKYHEGEGLSFSAEVEIEPEFELPEYKSLKLSAPAAEIGDEELENGLEDLRNRNASLVSLDREARKGDYLSLSLEATYVDGADAGEVAAQASNAVVRVGEENNPAEFNEALPGMNTGDEKTFEVSYPEDFGEEKLAGRKVSMHITVLETKSKEFPDLNDDFAKDLGFDSLDELRADTRQKLEARAREVRERALREEAAKQLAGAAGFEVPQVMVEERIDQRIGDVAYNMIGQGIDPTKAKVDWARVREDLRTDAQNDVRLSMVLDRIAEAEAIEVPDEELEAEIAAMAENARRPVEKVRQDFQKEGRLENLRRRLIRRSAMNLIVENADIVSG